MRKNQNAFTLLEIMIVVTIIALLMGATIYKLSGNVDTRAQPGPRPTSKHFDPAETLREHERILSDDRTRFAGARVPADTTATGALVSALQGLPKDPWNNNYIYLNPGRKNPGGFDLYSAVPIASPTRRTTIGVDPSD